MLKLNLCFLILFLNLCLSNAWATTQAVIAGTTDGLATGTTAEYVAPSGGGFVEAWEADDDDAAEIIPTPGVIDNLYVEITADPGNTVTRDFTIRWFDSDGAGWADSGLTCGITGDGSSVVTCNNQVGAVTVDTGDLIVLKQQADASAAGADAAWGWRWTPTTDDQTIVLANQDGCNQSSTDYIIMGGGTCSETSNADAKVKFPVSGTIKNLYCWIETAPGSPGETREWHLYRETAVDSGAYTDVMNCVMDGSETTSQDTVTEVAVTAGIRMYWLVTEVGSTASLGGNAASFVLEPTTSGEFVLAHTAHDSNYAFNASQYHMVNVTDRVPVTTNELGFQGIAPFDFDVKAIYAETLTVSPGAGELLDFQLYYNGTASTEIECTMDGNDSDPASKNCEDTGTQAMTAGYDINMYRDHNGDNMGSAHSFMSLRGLGDAAAAGGVTAHFSATD